MSDALLFDLGPLTCGCTDHVLEGLYKALGDPPDDEGIWEPHHDPWQRTHVESVTQRGKNLLQALQDALLSPTGESPELRKAIPWERWDAPEFERVRAHLAAVPAEQRTLDDWMMAVDWILQRYLGDNVINSEAEYIAVRSQLIGKVQAGMDILALNPDPTQIEQIIAILPTNLHQAGLPLGQMTPREAHILKFAAANTANQITALSQGLRSRMKRTLIDGIQKMTLGDREGTWNRLQQRLLDDFGLANRDWRRIAITETGNATATGYIASLSPSHTKLP